MGVSKMSSPPPQQDIGDTNESLTDSSLPIDFSNSSNITDSKKTSSVEKEVISANSDRYMKSFQPILKLIDLDSTRSEATRSMESRSMLATPTTSSSTSSIAGGGLLVGGNNPKAPPPQK